MTPLLQYQLSKSDGEDHTLIHGRSNGPEWGQCRLKLASLPSLIENYPPDNTNLGFAFSTVSNLTEMLEQAYGPHGGRGLALRVGRACFNYGVRQYGTQMGLNTRWLFACCRSLKTARWGQRLCRAIQQIYRSAGPCRRRGWKNPLAHRTLSALLGA